MTQTPWGAAEKIAGVGVEQRAGERRFDTLLEVLELRSGERLVRIAYATAGSARRGPVTLRGRDLDRLRGAILADPVVRSAILGVESGVPDGARSPATPRPRRRRAPPAQGP